MFCTNCGIELEDGSNFCPNCGAPLTPEAANAPEMPARTGSVGRWVLFVMLIISAFTYIPSLSSAMFLLSALLLAPFRVVQEFIAHYIPKKKTRNWIIAIIAIGALLLTK